MVTEKYPASNIDALCIFPGYVGCQNNHCENCIVFKNNKFPTSINSLYRFWAAYLYINGETVRKKMPYASRSRSKKQIEKDLSGKVHVVKLSKSDELKRRWRSGIYDSKKKKVVNKAFVKG